MDPKLLQHGKAKASPKRRHVGAVDRVDHLFDAALPQSLSLTLQAPQSKGTGLWQNGSGKRKERQRLSPSPAECDVIVRSEVFHPSLPQHLFNATRGD